MPIEKRITGDNYPENGADIEVESQAACNWHGDRFWGLALALEAASRRMSIHLSNPLDVQIMVLMYQTTCQSSVARAGRSGIAKAMPKKKCVDAFMTG